MRFTELEIKVLTEIKSELECGWNTDIREEYDTCWNPFYKTTKPEIKGAIASLVKKGVIQVCDCEGKHDVIYVPNLEVMEVI